MNCAPRLPALLLLLLLLLGSCSPVGTRRWQTSRSSCRDDGAEVGLETGSALLEKGLVLGRAEHDEGMFGWKRGGGRRTCNSEVDHYDNGEDDGNERRRRMAAVAVAMAAGCEMRFNSIGFLCE
ncbi:hypothetical protein EDB85DRAFT_1887815 [Lactarius pseudohatsudake]|nr:hypothetical protein EDB85DRAFT_1887815 [Lactarius pseudohatsudake]